MACRFESDRSHHILQIVTMKVYGPYLRKDGRKHVCIIHDDGRRQTQSYPRYLLEKSGIKVPDDMTVDHKDENFRNDDLKNYQLLSRADNIRKHAATKPAQIFNFNCPNCGKASEKFMRNVKANWARFNSGPFCSKSCAGKFSHPSNKKDTL